MNFTDYNKQVIEEFRTNEGKVGGPLASTDVLLLTTTGAKSGKRTTAPLGYFVDGDRLLVVASVMGAPKHPDWYLNLVANPDVTIEVGTETIQATAVPLPQPERDEKFAEMAAEAPFLADHQQKTSRVIPVVALERIDQDQAPAPD